jgi:hypothetical protein
MYAVLLEAIQTFGERPVPNYVRAQTTPSLSYGMVSSWPGLIRSALEMPLALAISWYLLPSP